MTILIECLNHSNTEIAERAEEILIGMGTRSIDPIVKVLTTYPASSKLDFPLFGGQRVSRIGQTTSQEPDTQEEVQTPSSDARREGVLRFELQA